jgi:tRNA(fMet)-specific endonuclease VapC
VSFLLDTDTCSAFLKGQANVFNRFLQHAGHLYISTVSVAELHTWAYRRGAPPGRMAALEGFLTDIVVRAVDLDVARECGRIRAGLLDGGRPVATTDLLIAATAMVHDLTVVTHNVRHYEPVVGLRVDDWL